MKTKEKMINALQELPDEASIEDAMERLLFLSKVERGLYQADTGNTISHAQVKKRMAKWLKNVAIEHFQLTGVFGGA